MKTNGAKRKIFNDAIDLLDQMEEAAAVPENVVRMLSAESIRPFCGHPFRMYEGERLEDMVQSIREHGVLNPVIVRKQEDGYEMLSGHNRQRAAMLAGIDKIPAIVKENLSDEDAIVYVIETNGLFRNCFRQKKRLSWRYGMKRSAVRASAVTSFRRSRL